MNDLVSAGRPSRLDAVCVGECLVMFVPDGPALPAPMLGPHQPTVAGAESNVAAHLAVLGLRSAWVSRVGTDPFGEFVVAQLAGYGVDTNKVATDQGRGTGVAFKEVRDQGTTVHYYRRDSAASAMDATTEQAVRELSGRVLHMSGITAALSPSCERLLVSLVRERPNDVVISFDVNWRPALWRERDPSVLLSLARSADIVFVGEDEASSLWRAADVRAIRSLLPEVGTLVVKHGPRGATVLTEGSELFVPALKVDVVELVGAGDAFAAGFLAGTVGGRDLQACGRLGTILAASTLQVRSDIAPPPPAAEIESLLALSEEEWSMATIEYRPRNGG